MTVVVAYIKSFQQKQKRLQSMVKSRFAGRFAYGKKGTGCTFFVPFLSLRNQKFQQSKNRSPLSFIICV